MKKIFINIILILLIVFSPRVFANTKLKCLDDDNHKCGEFIQYNMTSFYPKGFHAGDWSNYDGPDGYYKRCLGNVNGKGLCSIDETTFNRSFATFYPTMIASVNEDGTEVKKRLFSQIFELGVYDSNSLNYEFEEGKKYSIAFHFHGSENNEDYFLNTATNNYTCNDSKYTRFGFEASTGVLNYIYTQKNGDDGGVTSKKSDVFKDIRFNIRHAYEHNEDGSVKVDEDGVPYLTNEIILYIEFIPKRTYKSLKFYIGDDEPSSTSVPFINTLNATTYNYDDFQKQYGDSMYNHWHGISNIIYDSLDVLEVDDFIYSNEEDTSSSCWVDTVEDPNKLKAEVNKCDTLDIACHVSNIWEAIKRFVIPDENYLSDKFSELNANLEKELGILYFPISLIEKVVTRFVNYEDTYHSIHIPAINVPFFGKLTDETTFDIKAFFNSPEIKPMYDIYIILVWAICSIVLVRLCYFRMKRYFGGGML